MDHLCKSGRTGGKLPWVLLVPFVVMGVAYGWLAHLQRGLNENWERYREFWGGNPSEVYSHWLDVMLMTGGVVAMAWLLVVEAWYRKEESFVSRIHRMVRLYLGGFLTANGVAGVVLDMRHGEGTVVFVYVIFFLPMLVSTWYLMRRGAALLRWNSVGVVTLGLGVVVFHAVAQWYYEPSESGAPTLGVVFLWLGCVGLALVSALVRSIRSGLLVRVGKRCVRVMSRKAVFLGTVLFLVLLVGPPAAYGWHLRQKRQVAVYPLLDQVEETLSDDFVATLKREHTDSTLDKIPPSPSAEGLFLKIKNDNSLRIFIPVNDTQHLLFFGDCDSLYCDIRSIARGRTTQMDQGFLDSLIADGGTRQSGVFSVYWSQYIAGRVLKDGSGRVKAICVINGPRG